MDYRNAVENCGIFIFAVKGKDKTMMPEDQKAAADVLEKNQTADELHDDDEPTTEELIEMLRESLEDVKAGRTRPERELLRELRENLAADGDKSRHREHLQS